MAKTTVMQAPAAGNQAVPVRPTPTPEVWGYGFAGGLTPTGYVAYRMSSRGTVEVLTPRRGGELVGETKSSAAGRMMAALRKGLL